MYGFVCTDDGKERTGKTPLWITKISGHSGALVRVLADNLGTLESYTTDKRATKLP